MSYPPWRTYSALPATPPVARMTAGHSMSMFVPSALLAKTPRTLPSGSRSSWKPRVLSRIETPSSSALAAMGAE